MNTGDRLADGRWVSQHDERVDLVLSHLYKHPEGLIKSELLRLTGLPLMSLTRTLVRMVDDELLNKKGVGNGKKRSFAYFYTLAEWDGQRASKYKMVLTKPRVGRPHSQETKDKIAAKARGRKVVISEATRLKISQKRRERVAKQKLKFDEYAEWDVVDVIIDDKPLAPPTKFHDPITEYDLYGAASIADRIVLT